MLGTQSTGSSWTSVLCIACFVTAAAALLEAQTATKGHELTEVDEADLGATGTLTRCGAYVFLETRKYGELEVKQVHFAYTFAEGGVALISKNYRDFEVVIDDSRTKPKLILKRENPGLEKDRLELSHDSYQKAKGCVPSPKGDDKT